MHHRAQARLLTLLVFSAQCGCSSDSDQPDSVMGIEPRPVSGCEHESYATCDTESSACQKAIFSTVTCLRSSKGVSIPNTRTITIEQFGAELTAANGDEPKLNQEQLTALERGLMSMHLMKAGDLTGTGYVDSQINTVPAFYDPETDVVTFVHQNGKEGSEQSTSNATLAHEYVHALQDQEHDLSRLEDEFGTTTDSSLALHSLEEGEASMHEDTYLAAVWGLEQHDLDRARRYNEQETLAAEGLKQYSPMLAIGRAFPYFAGGLFVYRAYEAGGMAEVRRLFANPPSSSLEVRTGIAAVPVVADPPAPPDGYALLTLDTLGSELFFDFAQASFPTGDPSVFRNVWRGDRVYLYYKPGTADLAVLWRIKLATEPSRNQLKAGSWQSRSLGDDELVVLTTDANASAVATTLFDNATNNNTVSPTAASDDLTQAARLVLRPRILLRRFAHR